MSEHTAYCGFCGHDTISVPHVPGCPTAAEQRAVKAERENASLRAKLEAAANAIREGQRIHRLGHCLTAETCFQDALDVLSPAAKPLEAPSPASAAPAHHPLCRRKEHAHGPEQCTLQLRERIPAPPAPKSTGACGHAECIAGEVITCLLYAGRAERPASTPGEPLYPCDDCGKLRTKAEGGTTFTVCDECWEKHYPKKGESDRPQEKQAAPTPSELILSGLLMLAICAWPILLFIGLLQEACR